MNINTLTFLFERDLNRLVIELEQFKNKSTIWETANGISNSAGNLSFHLIGNLNHFVGHILGKTNYKRNRSYEFEGKDVPAEELIKEIKALQLVISSSLKGLNTKEFSKPFPIQVFDRPYSIEEMLIHLLGHLNYHLGQINYLRRVLES